MRRLALAVVVPLLLLLAACGGGSGGSAGSGSSASGSLPTVSGSYGDKPSISFPSGKPSSTLQKKVLHQGSGPVVHKGDLLVADYLGQIWHGKVFDNSYDRKEPAAFPIGVGQVIPGWDETLVGTHAGSRVLLVIPPDKGYGSKGNSQAGIKGTDTLVFVVDVVASYGKDAGADTHATKQPAPSTGPQVTGKLGQRPTVTVPKGTPPPTQPKSTVLAKGAGQAVKSGLVVVQYEAVNWQNKPVESTWKNGVPSALSVGGSTSNALLDSLKGVPVGSRVLLQLPAQDKSKAQTDSDAVVLDIVAEPGTAKEHAQQAK